MNSLKCLGIICFSIFFSHTSQAQCCTFTLEMYDSYGDGWTGGHNIDIIVNGVTVLTDQSVPTCACTSNILATATFAVCTGDVVSWNYSTGSSSAYLNEESFAIYDSEGNLIDSDGATITPGTTVTGAVVCPETCSDGIQNQDETGIDCGGSSCIPCECTNGIMDGDETAIDYGGSCGDCYDGIQNGLETGVDCGGPFCLPCNTNSTPTPSSTCCTASAQAIVYPTNCDQIGTSAYNLNSPVVNYTTVGNANCPPSVASGCGAYTSNGQWIHLDLADGVDYLQAGFQGGSVATGNHNIYASLFQGPDCSNLTEMASCQDYFVFSSGGYYVLEVSWSNLDPDQDVWLYLWDTSTNKESSFDIQFVGAAMNTNTSCPGSAALGEACNLGAQGATFTTPGSICAGTSSWGSNENTTFYSFTADDFTGSLEIENIICNDGETGQAQFGVWTSCASIGTYGADFLGCAVGTASISLSPLTPGQTYYIAADGFAGDNCSWGFTGTGILLPIELGSFTGFHTGHSVELEWSTITEKNNDYFIIQRTLDGIKYENIGIVDGSGNSTREISYSFTDITPYQGVSYYRIKQVDYNGEFAYTDVISVSSSKDKNLRLLYSINVTGQQVDYTYKGIVIDVYSDGSTQKRYQNPQE